MRLFAALPVPGDARAALERLTGGLRDAEWPVRWVRGEGLHLTLKFYGEVAPSLERPLAEALRGAAGGTPPLDLCATQVDCFPNARRARVIVATLEAPAALELLQDGIERAGAALGFEPEGRAFRPHVTLGRVRQGGRLPAGAEARLQALKPDIAFLAEEVVLYESTPAAGGSRYEPRAVVPLVHPTAAAR